jgi:hypothetical protein
MSWGYDQTNVNYFQVTRVSAKGVWVREIGCESVPGTQGFMCQDVKPSPGKFLDRSQWCGGYNGANPETFRRIQMYTSTFGDKKTQPIFNFSGRYIAFPVNVTETHYNSWYA